MVKSAVADALIVKHQATLEESASNVDSGSAWPIRPHKSNDRQLRRLPCLEGKW
jgi:hypothetical protein